MYGGGSGRRRSIGTPRIELLCSVVRKNLGLSLTREILGLSLTRFLTSAWGVNWSLEESGEVGLWVRAGDPLWSVGV